MHKIITSTLTLGAALFLLAGCSSLSSSSKTASSSSTTAKKSSSAQTSSSTSSQSSQAETSSASSSQVAATSSTPWNSAKAQQLRSFMNSWGPSMHQSYAELSPGDYQWFGGVNNTIGSYEGDGSTFEWSTTGTGNYDYNVVAMYNYNKSPQGDGNASTNIGEYHTPLPTTTASRSPWFPNQLTVAWSGRQPKTPPSNLTGPGLPGRQRIKNNKKALAAAGAFFEAVVIYHRN
ncbi:DUF4767 domain-containing protein [Limosilactobacillus fermentum]|uniref:DUF4767 domain-containing protein n=1 Tax=Limosilactobacillus fermentum TaxID=1613 RepID=UPI0021A32EB4|nr:DUF4767 domain-containing protein [Limosilactobacillus fermentum]MCT2874789.1 DUF4767 domain-containing protein [Limosilactobacillus fermentum]